MRGEGNGGGGRVYRAVVVLVEMAYRLPLLEGENKGDGPLSLGRAGSAR